MLYTVLRDDSSIWGRYDTEELAKYWARYIGGRYYRC